MIRALREQGIDVVGTIALDSVDTSVSRTAERAEGGASGDGSDAVIWEQVIRSTDAQSALSATFIAFLTRRHRGSPRARPTHPTPERQRLTRRNWSPMTTTRAENLSFVTGFPQRRQTGNQKSTRDRKPPSTTRLAPTQNDATGEARNATAAATSSGRPIRPAGIRERIDW